MSLFSTDVAYDGYPRRLPTEPHADECVSDTRRDQLILAALRPGGDPSRHIPLWLGTARGTPDDGAGITNVLAGLAVLAAACGAHDQSAAALRRCLRIDPDHRLGRMMALLNKWGVTPEILRAVVTGQPVPPAKPGGAAA